MIALQCIDDVVAIDPELMSGAPVFRGTRVPIQTLLDHLESGISLERFLDDFPTVSREQAVRFLELAGEAVVARLHADSA
ncbi:MAG: DUF433 domain-containing protein [Actinomycetota bacterium]